MRENQIDDFDANSGYEPMTWEEASLLEQRSDYCKNATRENMLKWHPYLLRRPEPLRTECIDWMRDRWDILEIDDNQLKSEVDFHVVRIKKYDNYSENWKLFYDKTNNRFIKVYSKKIWTTRPQTRPFLRLFNQFMFPYLDENRATGILPEILFMSENYIGLEWLSEDDGWSICKEDDFVRSVFNASIITKPAIDAARKLQRLHLSSCEYFKDNMNQSDVKLYIDAREAAQADQHEYGESFNSLNDDEHKLYIGSHNFWPRDFVTRIDPDTGHTVIRFIDFENLQICNATKNNYWYHKYKISTKSLYLQHYTQHVQIIKKHIGSTGPINENQFLATYIHNDTVINKVIDL
jgi:hypothetical protein